MRHAFFFGILLLILPFFVSAQEVSSNTIPGIGNPILLDTTPTSPVPNWPVTVSGKSFSLDFDRSKLSWTVNGAAFAEDTDEITFLLGDIGSRTVVRLTVTGSSNSFFKEIIIYPTTVDLLWQADTYTPPLYRGKALPSSRSDVHVVAIPQIVIDGVRISTRSLIYTWRAGGKVIGNSSGLGKNSIEVSAARSFNEGTVQVEVETLDGEVTALGFAQFDSVQPEILFYENDPVLGTRFEHALSDNFELAREEVMITAHPYFFSGKKRTNEDAQFVWELNGDEVTSPLADQSSIVLRQTGGSGEASVSLTIQSLSEILQHARQTFRIMFSGTEQSVF